MTRDETNGTNCLGIFIACMDVKATPYADHPDLHHVTRGAIGLCDHGHQSAYAQNRISLHHRGRYKSQNKSKKKKKKTYNSRYSLVVTDPTTNQPLGSLTRGERTGSRVFYQVWSYVETFVHESEYIPRVCSIHSYQDKFDCR